VSPAVFFSWRWQRALIAGDRSAGACAHRIVHATMRADARGMPGQSVGRDWEMAESGDSTSASPPPGLTEQDALRCVPGVRALLFRKTRSLEATNDLAQEVVLAAILAIREGRVREPAALPAYMLQTARHLMLMEGRRSQPLLVEDLPETSSAWAERPRTPLEVCEEDDLRRLARDVLDSLPTQRDRELITAFYVEGVSKQALMERFGLSREHFDRVMSRARGRMRDMLAERAGGARPVVGVAVSSSNLTASAFEEPK
jgi:RNA polymerase sigma factor (sigma-70 family)